MLGRHAGIPLASWSDAFGMTALFDWLDGFGMAAILDWADAVGDGSASWAAGAQGFFRG